MIRAITEPLRSKKIHIGMDEAHGVSEGRYRQLFGHKDSCQVVRHLLSSHISANQPFRYEEKIGFGEMRVDVLHFLVYRSLE
jgi:hypothetical protein